MVLATTREEGGRGVWLFTSWGRVIGKEKGSKEAGN